MKMMKRTVSFLLVLTLLLGLVPAVSAVGVWESGNCGASGSNVTWTLYEDGALVISGSGAMADYEAVDPDLVTGEPNAAAPWAEYRLQIKSIVVESGVTCVGNYAFYRCTEAVSASIAGSVKTIGEGAFSAEHLEVIALEELSLSKGLVEIRSDAFSECKNLTTVTIPDTVRTIGDRAFNSCEGITKLNLGKGVTTIGKSAFARCEGLTELVIPDSVTSLGDAAFRWCYEVKKLTIGKGLTTLPWDVFQGFDSLVSVTVPGNVRHIGEGAFSDSTSLKNVTLAAGVQIIDTFAFGSCPLESITFPSTITDIYSSAFDACMDLDTATFTGNAPNVATDAFENCAEGFTIYYPSNASGWSSPEWKGYRAYPYDVKGSMPETWPVNNGAHVITVASTRLGSDGKMTPLKGATVQILTKSGTIHTGKTDENGQYAYYNSDGKELRISAGGHQLLRSIYPMRTGESRMFLLDPLPADGAPYFSMLCGMLKAGQEFRDLRTEAVHYQKDDGMYMEPLFEIVAADNIVIDTVMLVQAPDSANPDSSGRSVQLIDFDLYDAGDPFRHIRAEADRFAPGAFYEQRPIWAAISYRYKDDPDKALHNAEPVQLKLFIDPKPANNSSGEENSITASVGTMSHGRLTWLENVMINSSHTFFADYLQTSPSIESDLLNFEYEVEHADSGNRKLSFAFGLGSFEQGYDVFTGAPVEDNETRFESLLKWVNGKEVKKGKALDFLESEIGKSLKEFIQKPDIQSISKVEGEIFGAYELELDSEDKIVPGTETGKILASITGSVISGKTILISGFPVYFEHVAEIAAATTLQPHLTIDTTTKQIDLTVDMEEIKLTLPKLSLEGGAGVRGVATVGIGGVFENVVTTSMKASQATTKVVGSTDAYFRVYVAFLLDHREYFGGEGKKHILYEYPSSKIAGSNEILTGRKLVQQAMEPELSLNNRDYLQKQGRWNGRQVRLMRDAGVSVLQTGVLPNAMPKLYTVNGRQVMLFLADDGTGALGSHTRLMYSVLENGIWSQPQPVWENGTGDQYFDSAVVNGQLVVAWQKLRGSIAGGDAMEMLSDLASKSEIAVAVWDGTAFTGQRYLTDDDCVDMMASVAGDADGIRVTWVTNDENNLMGTAGENTVRTVHIRDGAASEPEDLYTTDRFLTELVTTVSGSEHHVLLGSQNTGGSTDLIHLKDGQPVVVAENGAYAGLSNENGRFLWQNGGVLYRYSPALGQTEELITPDTGSVSSSYRFVTNGASEAVVWAEGQEPCRIMASVCTADGWGEPVVLADNIGQSVSFLDAVLTDEGKFVLAVNTVELTATEEVSTALQAGVITPEQDLVLTGVTAGHPDPKSTTQALTLTIENKGLLPVDGVGLTVCNGADVLLERSLELRLAPGSSEIVTEAVDVSALSGLTELTVQVEADNDRNPGDNTRSISLGHTDAGLGLDVYELEDTVVFLLTVSNASAIAADANIRIYRDAAEGEGLDLAELGTVTRGENVQYVYTLDKNTVDFDGQDSVYYLFGLECADDWDLTDNIRSWRVEKPVQVQLPSDMPMEELPNIQPEAIAIEPGDLSFRDPDAPAQQLATVITPADAVINAVTWHSADESVARVLPDGTVVAVGSGSTTVTAVLTEDLSASITVTVGQREEIHEHTIALDPGHDPTCTQTGLTDGAHCAECGEILTRQETIPAPGHEFSAWIVILEPTTLAEGLEEHTCIRCGHTEQRAVDKLANPFTDVPAGSFYYEPVLWAVSLGITNGTTATTFGPNDQCMRAQVVTFLWRAAGSPEPESMQNPFEDVKPSDFYYKAVLWAVEKGVTNGLDATHFGPFAYCNRAQVVTFLYRAMDNPGVTNTRNPFTDVPEGQWFTAPVLWAVENGITNGLDAVSFGPNSICNRAQIVTFLYRAYT